MGKLTYGEPTGCEICFLTTKDGDKNHYNLHCHFSPRKNHYVVNYNEKGLLFSYEYDKKLFESNSWDETLKFIESL